MRSKTRSVVEYSSAIFQRMRTAPTACTQMGSLNLGCAIDRTAWTRWVVKRGKNNKGRMLLVHLRRSGSSPRATQRTRMRDSRMSEGEKEGPARQRRTAHPRVVTGRPDRARGMRGLALTVPSCELIIWITALGKSRRRTARGP